MSTIGERISGSLQRPYTVGTFQKKLDEFHEFIRDVTCQEVEVSPEERRHMITENLRYDQFCDQIRALFGSDIKNQDLKALYKKISTNPEARVDWSELFGYFQSGGEEEEVTVGEEVSVFTVAKRRRVGEAAGDHRRRDIVQCLKLVPSADIFVTVSQKGALSVWTGKLRLQACTAINETAWATGCDYLPSMRRIVCCTERSIVIWDYRAKSKNQSIYSLKPLENSPQCVCPIPYTDGLAEDTVLVGDDQGYISLISIAAKDLNVKNTTIDKKNPTCLTIAPDKLSNPIRRRKIHGDWVLKIKYIPELRCFASCSPCSTQSFVLEEVQRLCDNGEVRGVSIPKGVNVFDYCSRANIIATGGVDKIIRVWHPHIFSRPTGKLIGHLFTIVGICCNERDQHIISLSTARVIRVWDIHTLTSLQVFTDNEERPGEKRIYSMSFDNKHERLLTGSSVIDAWPLTRAVQDTMQIPHTHDRPIAQILVNKALNQLVTLCSESIIKVWELESGKMVYSISDPHSSGIEITSIALDESGYRLVTGGIDGSLKVWDFGSGQELKAQAGKGSDEDYAIIGLSYYKSGEDRYILASGWNNKIRLIMDVNESKDLSMVQEFTDIYYWSQDDAPTSPEPSFNATSPLPQIGDKFTNQACSYTKEFLLSSHEVTCTCTQLPSVLVTGTNRGDLIVWDIDKAGIDTLLRIPIPEVPTTDSPYRSKQITDQRVNMVSILSHRVRKLDPAYIKKLTQQLSAPVPDETDEPPDQTLETPPDGVTPRVEESRTDVVKDTPDTNDDGVDDIIDDGGDEEEEGEADEDMDPDAKMIVETFDPIIASVHQDAFIRFWNMKGQLLREVTAITKRQGSPVTAICHDADCNLIVTGDSRGYVTMWNVGKFLEDPESENKDLIQQVVSWRAHLTKIMSVEYVDNKKLILSGSTDGSVRIWWGTQGRFIGFFGQPRSFNIPASEETASTPTLPYDITEGPLAAMKSFSARQRIRANQKLEYPLVFVQDKWKPFRRSAYVKQQQSPRQPGDQKFFEALRKPKAYNYHLESSKTGEMTQGAIFRALPVYRVKTPVRVSRPNVAYCTNADDEEFMKSSYLFGGGGKGGQPAGKPPGGSKGHADKTTPAKQKRTRLNVPQGRGGSSSPTVSPRRR